MGVVCNLYGLKEKLMRKVLSLTASKVFLLFIFVFVLGKGSQFFIPIILSNFLDPTQYGIVELSMSAGLIIVSIASMGSSTFISRSIIKKEGWINLDAVKFYLAGLSAVLLVLSIVMHVMNTSVVTELALAFSSILLLQGAISSELKSKAKRKSAIIVDVMLWATVLASAFIYIFDAVSELFNSLLWLASAHYAVLFIFYVKSIDFFKIRSSLSRVRYFKEGSKIVIMGFVSTLVATSGRLVVGDNLGVAAVGEYSALYRISIIPIITHQIIMLYFYRMSFSKSRKQFIYLGNFTFVIISFISLIAWLSASFFAPYLGLAFENSLRSNPIVFTTLMISVPFWSAISVNELAYSQNVQSRIPLLVSLSYVSLAYLMTSYSMVDANLDSVSVSISLMIVGYYFINSLSLAKVGVTVPKLPMLFSALLLILLSSYLLKTTF